MKRLFTCESVTKGHPDKVCDQISDAILDAILAQDADSHAAIECMAAHDTLFIVGEVKTNAKVNYEAIARNTIKGIGYDKEEWGFQYNQIDIICKVHKQSADIDMGVSKDEETGAGDQGMMFGYANNETEDYLPLAYSLASRLAKRMDEIKSEYTLLGPDGKSQVTVEYEDNKIKRIDTIVLSNQHSETLSLEELKEILKREVIDVVVPAELIDADTKFYINPTGRFVIGGPVGDSGLTGRKIIVDTYGGYAPHGGGAFSGKDPSKVDRSGAYYTRFIAKHLVAAGLCDEATIQVAYAIGISKPVSLTINTNGTEKVELSKIYEVVEKFFDLSVDNLINELNLKSPIYNQLAAYGHFSNENAPFEKLTHLEEIKNYIA